MEDNKLDILEEYLIQKLEEESKNAYDEEILDKVREIKNEKH